MCPKRTVTGISLLPIDPELRTKGEETLQSLGPANLDPVPSRSPATAPTSQLGFLLNFPSSSFLIDSFFGSIPLPPVRGAGDRTQGLVC